MKRFLFRLSAFILFAIFAYILLVVLFGLYAPTALKKNLVYTLTDGYDNTYSRLEEANRTRNIDVLVLGSSHAYRGYDPRIFRLKNIKIFNLGTSAQTPLETEFLIDKFLDRLNPKVAVLDAYPKLFESDGAESMIDLLQNGHIDKDFVKMTFKINDIRSYNSLIYCSYRQIFGLNKRFVERLTIDSDRYISGGYVETYKTYNPTITPESSNTISAKQMNAFDRTITKLKEKGVKIILVQSPVTVRSYLKRQNNDELDSLFSRKGTYYNFNKMLQLPDSLFYNDDHLNQNGVNVFNKKLIEIMERSGLISR